jgi:biopolymer transport protein ExbD
MIPMIDLVFLTLGAIVALLTQMELIRSIPVSLTRVGQGSSVVTTGEFDVVTLTAQGLTLNGRSIELDEIARRDSWNEVVFRVDREVHSEEMIGVLAEFAKVEAHVQIEVKEVEAP